MVPEEQMLPVLQRFFSSTRVVTMEKRRGTLYFKKEIPVMNFPAFSATCLFTLAAAVGLVTGAALIGSANGHAQAAPVDEYTTVVKPILEANCTHCHNGVKQKGGLSLETRDRILRGGKDGTVIVPFHPEQSLLVALIRHEGPSYDPMPMPPPPHNQLSPADIAAITTWIKDGAVIPQ